MMDKEKILRAIKLKIDENCIEIMQDIYEKALENKDNDLTKINIKINEQIRLHRLTDKHTKK